MENPRCARPNIPLWCGYVLVSNAALDGEHVGDAQ